jgi:ornithine cyclodeaminase
MKVLFVNESGVRELLPMETCVALMREALAAFSRGDAVLPLRSVFWLPGRSGAMAAMPGYLGAPRSFGIKVISVMPGNHGTPYDSHQGVVMLFGLEHGEPLAIMDASAITAIRTAAASAAATDALAGPDAGDLALIGTGTQARTHLAAMHAVRPLRRVRVWSRSRSHAERFAEEESARLGIPVQVSASAEGAVRGADLVCTTTASAEPVVRGEWLSPGAHVNAVGACFPSARELDTAAVARSRFFTDCRESCLAEAGDFLIPLAEGSIAAEHLLGEIGQVFLGDIAGRVSRDDVTVYESLGIAIEDLAAAHHVHRVALESGAGTWIDWGGPA